MSSGSTKESNGWQAALRRIRAEIVRRAMRGGSVVDELLAERRDEASRE